MTDAFSELKAGHPDTETVSIKNFRIATAADAPGILAIYGPFCAADSPVSFELEPPTLEDMAGRITGTLTNLPWLVAEDANGKILGYAYASPHMARAAYRWSVNVSIYLSPDARRQGLGGRLYKKLFAVLRDLGYFNAYAGITLPNDGSLAIHRALGFVEVGIYERVGYKCDRWLDVAWWSLLLQEHPNKPAEPKPFPQYVSEKGPDNMRALLA